MSSIHRLLRRRIGISGEISPPDPVNTIYSMLRSQTSTTTTTRTIKSANVIVLNSRTYSKLPHFFRKSRDFTNGFASSSSSSSSPLFFNSPFSFGSSTTNVTASFVGWYLGLVKTRPILTKSVTCSLVYVAADLSSQTLERPVSEPYDFLRTLRMAGYGLLILGPSLHFWFNFVTKRFPKRDLTATFKKIIMGQTLFGPAMTAIFFSTNASLQGENGSEIISRLKRDLLPTMMNGVMYWPICDFITFKFIPVHLQPLASNSFSYMWTIYMTYMASREKVDSS